MLPTSSAIVASCAISSTITRGRGNVPRRQPVQIFWQKASASAGQRGVSVTVARASGCPLCESATLKTIGVSITLRPIGLGHMNIGIAIGCSHHPSDAGSPTVSVPGGGLSTVCPSAALRALHQRRVLPVAERDPLRLVADRPQHHVLVAGRRGRLPRAADQEEGERS